MQEIRWNPQRQLWETEQADLFSGLSEPYSETWPTAGMTRSGRLLPLPMSGHRIGGNESLSSPALPTPRATDGTDGPVTNCPSVQAICDGSAGRSPRLSEMAAGGLFGDEPGVALLPTPCAQQSGNSPEEHLRKKPGRKVVTDLAILVENGLMETGGALLPTPRSSDTNGAGHHGDGGMDLRTTVSLLCTPSASDGAGGKTSRSGGRIDEPLLGGQAREMASAWGKYEPAIRRWEAIVGPAPAPTEPNKNGNPRLSAAFSEWLMGWPAGWVTDPAIGISRNDQLRIVGNGVCPQQAAAALRFLLTVAATA